MDIIHELLAGKKEPETSLEEKIQLIDVNEQFDPAACKYHEPYPEARQYTDRDLSKDPQAFSYNGRLYVANVSDLDAIFTQKQDWAIMLIDMQFDFLKNIRETRLNQMIKYQLAIITYAAKKDIPLLCIEYRGYGRTVEPLITATDKMSRLHNFYKSGGDAFEKTGLTEKLKELQTKKTLIMGVKSDKCVHATFDSARAQGYDTYTSPYVIETTSEDHERIESLKYYKSINAFTQNFRIIQRAAA